VLGAPASIVCAWSTPEMGRWASTRVGMGLPSLGCREPATRRFLPPFFMEEGCLVPSVLVAGLVTTMAVTFWYAWLFNHTAGSVLLVVMAHSVPLGGHRTLAQLPPPLG
jgi:hypothetical protein